MAAHGGMPLRKAGSVYRCHFTKDGTIVYGEDLTATTRAGALAEASAMFKGRRLEFNGFEVWRGDQLLHVFDDRSADT